MSTATVSRVFNFSAGPAALPLPVLQQIQDELLSLPGVGASVLEISHRCAAFDAILDETRQRLVQLLQIPDTHDVLFVQGGAILQNTMVPANLLTDPQQTADYIVTGSWGKKSSAEVAHYGNLNVAFNGKDANFSRVPESNELQLTPGAAYCHLTSNETIQGVQFSDLPDTGDVPIVVDHSSDLLCQPIPVSKYGLIYACAQKNSGIAGVTVVIIRKDLLERSGNRLGSYLSYANHAEAGSRFNTPPTFAVYVSGLVYKWLQEEMGGLEKMAQVNRDKAAMLYQVVDQSEGFYQGHAQPESRSIMNVVFKLGSDELNNSFLAQAAEQGMTTLKGHRSLGGIRASIYNAMPVEGVETLAQFMKDFAQQNG